MSGHLCLKWNNHSSSFLKSISSSQLKKRFCDATIACQGKYFPVHRLILTTCSEYFDEIFERIECQHPFIVFKDIEPGEMELLLNYMYQGEVNVVQEKLPILLKAAEALRIKGLAIPDDLPANKDSASRKRKSNADENSRTKCRPEDINKKKRRDSMEVLDDRFNEEAYLNNSNENTGTTKIVSSDYEQNSPLLIKQEPTDYDHVPLSTDTYVLPLPTESHHNTSEDISRSETKSLESSSLVKFEEQSLTSETLLEQASDWSDCSQPNNILRGFPDTDTSSENITEAISEPPVHMGHYTISDGGSNPPFRATNKDRCSFCSYKTYDKHRLQRHIMFKHKGYRPHPCPFCPLRCALRTDLERHMLIHTGDRPFECSRCKYKFRRNSHLKVHMKKCGFNN